MQILPFKKKILGYIVSKCHIDSSWLVLWIVMAHFYKSKDFLSIEGCLRKYTLRFELSEGSLCQCRLFSHPVSTARSFKTVNRIT